MQINSSQLYALQSFSSKYNRVSPASNQLSFQSAGVTLEKLMNSDRFINNMEHLLANDKSVVEFLKKPPYEMMGKIADMGKSVVNLVKQDPEAIKSIKAIKNNVENLFSRTVDLVMEDPKVATNFKELEKTSLTWLESHPQLKNIIDRERSFAPQSGEEIGEKLWRSTPQISSVSTRVLPHAPSAVIKKPAEVLMNDIGDIFLSNVLKKLYPNVKNIDLYTEKQLEKIFKAPPPRVKQAVQEMLDEMIQIIEKNPAFSEKLANLDSTARYLVGIGEKTPLNQQSRRSIYQSIPEDQAEKILTEFLADPVNLHKNPSFYPKIFNVIKVLEEWFQSEPTIRGVIQNS